MFSRSYTREELDRGIDMRIHPVTGQVLSDMRYHAKKRQFFILSSWPMGWAWEAEIESFCPRIANGRKQYAQGTDFPSHWTHNPWTGEQLYVST